MHPLYHYLDPDKDGVSRSAWFYTPGQRRVRAAPDAAYDGPVEAAGGSVTYDEVYLFSGKMDRFDFKLVGKKELYIPYNNFKLNNQSCSHEQTMQSNLSTRSASAGNCTASGWWRPHSSQAPDT